MSMPLVGLAAILVAAFAPAFGAEEGAETPRDASGEVAVGDDSLATDPPDTTGAPSRPFYGFWRWYDEGSLDYGILHAYASASLADSIARVRALTVVAVSDTARYSFFTPKRWMLTSPNDYAREDDEVDVATGHVSRTRYIGERRYGFSMVLTPESYGRSLIRRNSREAWLATGRRLLAVADEGGTEGINISLPAMPSFARGIFGDGNSTLSVSGSERISFSGNSRWFPYRRDTGLTSQSKFPELDMKQDLFLKLSGSIGDKVHVDVDQNSNAETSLENNIRIRYEGYEDDVIRRVNLGNTSLSLPGTRYVSYGGRHEGLFGISAEAQVGPIKITSIASKQESEATTQSVPSRNAASTPIPEISARDYIRRRYFFLDDPNRVRDVQVSDGTTTVSGPAIVPLNIESSSIVVLKDDDNGGNNNEQGAIEAWVTPSGYPPCACGAPPPCDTTFPTLDEYETFDVYELIPDIDYRIHTDRQSFEFRGLVIELLGQTLGDAETLVAAFRTSPTSSPVTGDLDGDGAVPDTVGTLSTAGGGYVCNDLPTFKMISPPLEELRQDDLTTGPWAPAHDLELRNFYRLGGRNVQDLDLEVLWDRSGGTTNPTNFRNTPYIEVVGLDVERLDGTTPVPGQDGEVDARYLDADDGVLHFPQLRPFAPDSFDVNYRRSPFGVVDEIQAGWPEDLTLTGANPDSGDYPEPEIYDSRATVFRLPSDTHVDRYKMSGSFRSPINVIELNRFNIIEDSETVTAGGRTLTRGTHYDIDYEFGTVTIRESANVGPDEDVNVTFAYAPLFGTASRTLAGFSSSLRPEGGNYGISTTWMFESKGNPERRVKLGEEPTRTIIGELSGDYKSESALLTNLLERLPFYTPATRSQITMSGALGVSLPNPNTKGEAYIDDFDASRDSRDLSMSRRSWWYPAIPLVLQEQGLSPEEAAARRGNMSWYDPRRAALRRDLNPELSAEEGDDAARVIEWWLEPNLETTEGELIAPEENWYGLTQAISNTGEDLSTAQFLDIWINDFNDPDVRDSGVLYIDIGTISEDAVWWKTGPDGYLPPEGVGLNVYDTEDANEDGRLDECNADPPDESCNEDTGLDGTFDGPGDPSADDWSFPDSRDDEEDDPLENRETFRFVNNTELNSILDSEDLDGDQNFDDNDNYFTYRFDLSSADSNLVITNVLEDFGDDFAIDPDNGWRRVRIPLGEDFEFDRVGIPDYTLVKHVRVWMTGVRDAVPIQIASVEFIGNKWLTGAPEAPILNGSGQPADDSELALGQKFAVSVVNNKDNGDIYEPAFELERDRDQAGDEFEGYISLDLLNFPAGHSGTAYRRFPQDQDYTFYESLEFYTQLGLPRTGPLSLEFFIRFGSTDGNNYYEYRKPVQTGAWDLIQIPITDLSNLKQNLPSEQQFIKQPYEGGATISMRGRPSFSRVRQITVGVTNSSGGFLSRGSVWVNELRLDDVQRNTSTAGQFNLATTLSDLATFSLNLEGRDADFQQIGQSRGTGINDRRLRWNSSVNVDRFAPRLQMRIPVRYSYSRSTQEPKFQTGNDIVFEGENRDLNITQSITRNFSTEYSRSPSSNPLLKYTVDALRASYSRDERMNVRPTAADSSVSWSASLNYNVAAPPHPFVQLPLGLELDYMPSQFTASGATSESETRTWQRPSSDLTEPLEFQNETSSKSRTLSWSTSYRPFLDPNVNYQFQSTRDLLRDGTEVGGVNLGLETNRTESLSAGYSLTRIADDLGERYPVVGPALSGFANTLLVPLTPSVNWSGRSSSRVDVSRLGDELRPRAVQNSNSTTLRGTLPVPRIFRALKAAARASVAGGDDEEEDEEGDTGSQRGRGKGTRRSADDDERGDEESDAEESDGRQPGAPRGGDGTSGEEDAGSGSGPSPFGMNFTVGNVTGQYTRSRGSSYSLINGSPSLQYRLGLSRDLDPGIDRLATNTSSRNDSDVYTFSTTAKLAGLRFGGTRLGSVLDLKASFTDESTDRVSTTLGSDLTLSAPTLSITERRTWPDLQFTASNVQNGIPILDNRFRRITLTSRYSRSTDVSGDQSEPRRRVTESKDWSPFLALETTMKNGLRLTVRRNERTANGEANGLTRTLSENYTSDLTVSVQHTIDRKRSVDLPFGRGKRVITTSIDITLNASRRRMRNASVDANTGRETVLSDTRELNLSAELGYNFTRNIHGTGRINYGERRDIKTISNTSRTLGLTVTATFQF